MTMHRFEMLLEAGAIVFLAGVVVGAVVMRLMDRSSNAREAPESKT